MPSLWRVWDFSRRALLAAVLGTITIGALLLADAALHRRLAHPRRRRTPAVRYPIRV